MSPFAVLLQCPLLRFSSVALGLGGLRYFLNWHRTLQRTLQILHPDFRALEPDHRNILVTQTG